MDQRLRKEHRLRLRNDFRAVFSQKWSAAGKYLVIYGRPNELGYNRLGLSVGRRYGNAIHRNRFKRRCREVFRLTRAEQPQGWDWIVLPLVRRKNGPRSEPVYRPDFENIRDDFLQQIRRLARKFNSRDNHS